MTEYFLQQSQQTRARPHFTPVILVARGKQNFLMDGMYVPSDNVIVIVRGEREFPFPVIPKNGGL